MCTFSCAMQLVCNFSLPIVFFARYAFYTFFSLTCFLPTPPSLSSLFWSLKHFSLIVHLISPFQSDLPLSPFFHLFSIFFVFSFQLFTSALFSLCASSPLQTAAAYSQLNPTYDRFLYPYRFGFGLALYLLFKSPGLICHDQFLSNSTCDPQCCHICAQYAAFHI